MQTLRKLASDYMLNHEEEFLPFLTDTKTGEVYTPGTLTLHRPFHNFFNFCHELVRENRSTPLERAPLD